jgi:Tat protein secretion system quality control protein TatD with DNase activity
MILLETDAPEVYRGKASEPKDLLISLQGVRELKGGKTEEIADRILQNTQRFFGRT